MFRYQLIREADPALPARQRRQFGDDHTRPGAPLLPSERKNSDGSAARVGYKALRSAFAAAAAAHLPDWPGTVTPHLLRHFSAGQLYQGGMDLIAIQETLGHAWVAVTMQYINSWEFHRPGEKPQVTWSAQVPNGFRCPVADAC